jgi:uncharacterized protein YprB with RNaseH-like and TPR domain
VDTRTIGADRFGLESLAQVGHKRAQTLIENGFIDVADVADSSIAVLSDITGIGTKTAEKIYYSAEALTKDTVFRLTHDDVPVDEPLYIDIETDGLTPTMIWLIGVFDPQADRYMAFSATDPDNKGKAISVFASWFAANAADRTVVAYNGMGFDFPSIANHIHTHCPEYSDDWDSAFTFDPLWWATKQDNALLPGRTNKLEDVAQALGWDVDETGLTGQIVGERFTRWMRTPCDETELDWEAHKSDRTLAIPARMGQPKAHREHLVITDDG